VLLIDERYESTLRNPGDTPGYPELKELPKNDYQVPSKILQG
jgi:hypothetical protein